MTRFSVSCAGLAPRVRDTDALVVSRFLRVASALVTREALGARVTRGIRGKSAKLQSLDPVSRGSSESLSLKSFLLFRCLY